MRLVGLGRSQMAPVARGQMVAQGSQLTYRRGSLTEWYRNSPSGLEQGFTLGARPAGSSREAITLHLGLSGNLRAQLERGGGTVDLSLPDGQRVLRYGGLTVHDAVGRSLPAHLELTGQQLRLVVQDRGARYPIQIDPYAYQTELDLATAGDELGFSVALSGNGSIALLGASGATVNGQTAAGAGEVFTRSGTTWTYQTQLDLGTNTAGGLGSSVALSSDGTTALLGAFGRTVNGVYHAGAGEVFIQGLSQTGVSNGTQASASVGGTDPNTSGSYTATAFGASGSVTVATYPSNPTSAKAPPNGTNYFDVKASTPNSFTSVSIVDCNLAAGNTLYWFDGTTWKVATPQRPNTPSAGCITLTVSSTSSPTLS